MIKSKFIPFFVLAVVFFIIGVLVNDVPYFEVERRIRPFEVFTFFIVTSFGYWFQHNQRKINSESSVLLKLLEDVLKEICKDLDSIVLLLEDCPAGVLDDSSKKKIHMKIKNVSCGVSFVAKKTKSDLINTYVELKDAVISEEFSGNEFKVSVAYLKDVNTRANDFRMTLRESICSHIGAL